jgi:hypothetical protein
LRRHLSEVDRCLKLRRLRQVKCQRDVLRDVALAASDAMLGNEETNFVPLVAGILALCERLIHLLPDAHPDGFAVFEAFVVSAGIQRRRHQKNGL